jgi:Zn-dependent protease with chaperone function
MTREEFDALVVRLEREAETRPRAYRLRVLFLALLGYAYIFLIVGVLLVVIGVLVWGVLSAGRGGVIQLAWKVGLALAGLTVVILRSLWVRLPPPEGLTLSPGPARTLWRAIEEIRRSMKGPRVHCVLLTDEFNASITQIPRLGLLGWQKNYLTLGMPLLHALSPAQFRAVLAHEFGHLRGAHSRFAGWVYRVRKSWYQLMEKLKGEQHWGAFIFDRFFRWYAPFFGAYSFVLARANEYEADRCAARLAGSRHTADALINLEVYAAYLVETFWPALYAKANHQPDPSAAPFTEMRWAFRADLEHAEAYNWLDRALARKTTSENTHPCLADRLAALDERPQLPAPVEETAAQRFLGTAIGTLTERLNRIWAERITPSWRERYAYACEAAQGLRDLEKKVQEGPLSVDEAWQRAAWTEELRGSDAALPLFQAIVTASPDHTAAEFSVGRILLSQNKPEGVQLLDNAMRRNADYILPGCELIYGFLMGQGKDHEAERYLKQAEHQARLLELARQERSHLGFKNTYLPHQLPHAEIVSLRNQLARHPQISRAYLVRKRLTHFPEKPLYALALHIHVPWYRLRSKPDHERLTRRLAQEMAFPGETLVFVLNSANATFKKIVQGIPGSEIFRR